MRKNNFIFLLTITLLALLSSNVMAAVSRGDFEAAISSFANSMNDEGYRYSFTENKDLINLGYKSRTAVSEDYVKGDGTYDTALYFSDDSFIAYIYHEVIGLNMMTGGNVCEQKDIYNDIFDNSSAPFNYFDHKSNKTDIKIWDNNTDSVISSIRPGDILIEVSNIMGIKTWGTVCMYIGDNKLAYFEDDKVKIFEASAKKNVKFDVARVKDKVLEDSTILKTTFNGAQIITNATTMDDALKNLNDGQPLVVNMENEGFVFTKTDGTSISRKEIAQAIREGFLSEYGNIKDLSGNICIQLEYKDDGGGRRVFGNSVQNYECGLLSKNDTSTSNYIKIESYYDKLELEDYKNEMYLYWGTDYIVQSKHDLYVGIYIYNNKTGDYQPVGESIKIANGAEYEANGKKVIDCFSEIVKVDGGLGRKPTLQEFLDIEMVMPEETYELHFSNIGDVRTITKENGSYKKNSLNEILFTVNKNGTYLVKIKPEGGEVAEKVTVYLARYDIGNNDIVGHGHFAQIRIRNAGIKTEGICEDKLCSTIKYDKGEYIQNAEKKAFPFVSGKIYVFNTENTLGYNVEDCTFEITYISDALVEIRDHEAERNSTFNYLDSQSNMGVKEVHMGGQKSLTMFERLEFMMSFCVRNAANGVILMMNQALGWVDETNNGNVVSIDSIIFDEYPLTKLNLFTKSLKNGETQNSFIASFANNINVWFHNFTIIAIVAYLAILLYMGIRITMSSTASKQAMYKELFTQWVTGVIILFLFPVVIRYAIEINTSFVGMVGETVEKMDKSEATTQYIDPDETTSLSTDESNSEEAKNMELNPFRQDDKGYMAVMARRAHNTERLSYAFVYLVMSFQLVIIAVMYYKRLFMVAFLIVIFPIVMIAHVLEKVANVKMGGAFSKWTKEILITIFVQSIHAIIYSFASATVLAAGDSNNDWILMLVGVTFLFNGESILKKILGYDSQSTPSLVQTATKTAAAVTLTKKAVTSVTDNVVGAGSHLHKAWQYHRETVNYSRKASLVNVIGQKPKEYRMPPASELEHYKPEYTEFGDAEAQELGAAIQVMNHMDLATPDQINRAMGTIERAKETGTHKELLKDLKMGDEQFDALQRARNNAARDAVSGHKTKQQIDMELTMELEQIFAGQGMKDIRAMKVALYSQMASPMANTRLTGRDTTEEGVKNELQEARDRYATIKGNIVIADKSVDDDSKELEERAVKLLQGAYGKDRGFTREQYQMALSVCMLKNASSGRYDANELMTSANFAFRNQGKSAEFQKMAESVGCDLEELRYAVAEAVCEKGYGKSSTSGREWRHKDNKKMAPKQKEMTRVCEVARGVLDETEEHVIKREEELQAGKINPKKEAKREEIEMEEMPEVISVVGAKVMEQEQRRLGISEEAQVLEIVEKRRKKNTREQQILGEFSKEMILENKSVIVNTIDGMTRNELIEQRVITHKKGVKEAAATIQTTTAAVVGAPIGAGIAIGLSDSDDTLTEALGGALGGAAIVDTVAEKAYGENVKKKVKMLNPYTGEMEVVEVTVSGAFADKALTIGDLPPTMSAKLKEQFLNNKLARDQKWENEKTAKLQKEEYKKRLDEAYKRAMDEATRNGNNTNT